jgi:hypothetical protein
MKQIQTFSIIAAALLALTVQTQAQDVTEDLVQVATVAGFAYQNGTPLLKTKIDLKAIHASVGITDPKSHVLILSTCTFERSGGGKTVTRRLLALRKVAGGTLADDINLLDFSNVSDYNDPQADTVPSAFDSLGAGYQLDGVSIRSHGGTRINSSIFSGAGGETVTKISKGTPLKRVYQVSMEGLVGGNSALLLFKVGAGKLYIPKS